MEKTLEYYIALPYVIEITPIKESLGGGYSATIPQLGRLAVVGDGETVDAALADLENVKRERFKEYLAKGVAIPEPAEERETFSGRFVVRVPKALHAQLVESARENGISLNHFVSYLLSTNLSLGLYKKCVDDIHKKLEIIGEDIWKLQINSWSYELGDTLDNERTQEADDGKLYVIKKAA